VNSEVNDYKKRLKGYDIKFLMPNIEDQAKKDKEIFDEKMKKVQNIIDKGNQKLKGQD
jgi:cellobiose-specific phosphotransferase system component IIB